MSNTTFTHRQRILATAIAERDFLTVEIEAQRARMDQQAQHLQDLLVRQAEITELLPELQKLAGAK